MAEDRKPYSIPACNLALAVRGDARLHRNMAFCTKFRKGAMEALVERAMDGPHAPERKELNALLARLPYDDAGREIVEAQREKIRALGLYEYAPEERKKRESPAAKVDAALLAARVLEKLNPEPGSIKTRILEDWTLRIEADFGLMGAFGSSRLDFLEKGFGGVARRRYENNSWQVRAEWCNWGVGQLIVEHDERGGKGDFVLDLHGALGHDARNNVYSAIAGYREGAEMGRITAAEFMQAMVERFRAAPDSIMAVWEGGRLRIRWETVAKIEDSDLEPLRRRFGDEGVGNACMGNESVRWMGKGIGKTFFASKFPCLAIGKGEDGKERAVLELFGIPEDEYDGFRKWMNKLMHERRCARPAHG